MVRAETVAVICRNVIIAPRHMAIRVTGREPRTDERAVPADSGAGGAAVLVVTGRPQGWSG
ncbi:hypothetical protein GCM10011576_05530 [Micromonospora parathelypteridis]|nr:hypothetical protein GCM10011576_05530 [Micromonospora parathelypteridis]